MIHYKIVSKRINTNLEIFINILIIILSYNKKSSDNKIDYNL